MAACNQTDIPVLNIQEDPCIQGSLITSCIFYGLAIDYLGAQSSSSFLDVLGLIVAKLEAGNIDATNLEEDNRAQALLIEDLQNSIVESLVTLSEVQVLLEQCCPEQTTTTTVAPTSTTTTTNSDPYYYYSANLYFCPDCINIVGTGSPVKSLTPLVINSWYTLGTGKYQIIASSAPNYMALTVDAITQMPYCNCPQSTTTTSSNVSSLYFTLGPDGNSACNSMTGVTLYWAGLGSPINQRIYQDPALTIPWNDFTYAVNSTNVYNIANGYMSIQGVCSDFTTTTSTTSTTTIAPSVPIYFGATSQGACDENQFNTNVIIDSGATSICDTNTITADFAPYGFSNSTIYVKRANQTLVRRFLVDASGAFATQTGVCESCITTTTTTTVAVPGSYVFGTTGISPWDIVLDSSGNAYTSNWNSNNVSKITPDGVSTILGTTGAQPRGITIDSQNNIYVINSGDNTVTKITPSGVSTVLGSAGSGANDIAIDQQGNIYVNNNGPNTITKITPQGVSTTFAGVASGPQCITTDSQGNIYTASPNVVNKITPGGVSTILGNTLYQPLDIIVDNLGNVYVSTAGNQVVKITPSGVSTSLGYVGSSPYGITLDSYGNIYTSNALSNNVSKITPGGVITVIGTTELAPMAIAVDAAGNVYTANSNSDNVTKIVQAPTTTTVAPTTVTPVGLTCPEGFPNKTTGNGTMTLSNGVTLTTTYTGPTLLSGNQNTFTACGNSFRGNNGAGGTMFLNYNGGPFTLNLTFSQPQSHIAFSIFNMGIFNKLGVTESYTFTTNGGNTQITELNGCGNFQVQGFNTLVGANTTGAASDGSGAIQVTSSGLFTEVTITGNNSGSLNGIGIDLHLCSNLIIE